ncbi:MAG: helix-turn-helix transcriptional regulator [Fimbriimonadaceae bacterium]
MVSAVLLTKEAAEHLLDSETGFFPHPKLAALNRQGVALFPTDHTIALADAGAGLDLFVAYAWTHPKLQGDDLLAVRAYRIRQWFKMHSGFRFGRLLFDCGESELVESLGLGMRIIHQFTFQAGLTHATRYFMCADHSDASQSQHAFLCQLFEYTPPRFFFTSSQRELLLMAREWETDQEIAEKLYISIHAVRERWRSIFARVEIIDPGFLPYESQETRGGRKRRELMKYLASHPEELRPYKCPKSNSRLIPLSR